MILYHGSNQSIVNIDLSRGKKFKDFGQGFYTILTYISKVRHTYTIYSMKNSGVAHCED